MLKRTRITEFSEYPATCKGWRAVFHPNPEGRIEPYYSDYATKCKLACDGREVTVLADEPYPIVRKVSLAIAFDEPRLPMCWARNGCHTKNCIPQHTELEFLSPPTKEELCLRLKEICSLRLAKLMQSSSQPTDSSNETEQQ